MCQVLGHLRPSLRLYHGRPHLCQAPCRPFPLGILCPLLPVTWGSLDMFCRLPVNPWPHLPFWSPEWTKRWLWPHMPLGEMSCEAMQWDEQKVQVRSLTFPRPHLLPLPDPVRQGQRHPHQIQHHRRGRRPAPHGGLQHRLHVRPDVCHAAHGPGGASLLPCECPWTQAPKAGVGGECKLKSISEKPSCPQGASPGCAIHRADGPRMCSSNMSLVMPGGSGTHWGSHWSESVDPHDQPGVLLGGGVVQLLCHPSSSRHTSRHLCPFL